MRTLAPQGLTSESLFGWTQARLEAEKKQLAIITTRLQGTYDWPMTHHDHNADLAWARDLEADIAQVEYLHRTGTPWPEDR